MIASFFLKNGYSKDQFLGNHVKPIFLILNVVLSCRKEIPVIQDIQLVQCSILPCSQGFNPTGKLNTNQNEFIEEKHKKVNIIFTDVPSSNLLLFFLSSFLLDLALFCLL